MKSFIYMFDVNGDIANWNSILSANIGQMVIVDQLDQRNFKYVESSKRKGHYVVDIQLTMSLPQKTNDRIKKISGFFSHY